PYLRVCTTNRSSVMSDTVPNDVSAPSGASARAISWNSIVPNRTNASNTPSRNPKSPMRLTMNAFFPASDADCFTYQKPISRYEHSPTPSHPMNRTRKLEPRTSTSMNAANRFKYEKYRANSASGSSSMYAVE